jgi:ATP-dependent Lon protease
MGAHVWYHQHQGQIAVNDSALHALIQSYAREAGVRELYKHIEKIFRKVAYKVPTSRHIKLHHHLKEVLSG